MAEGRRNTQGLGREIQLHPASDRDREPPGPLDLQAESRAGVGANPQPAQPAIQSPARRTESKAQSADEARSGHHLTRAAQPAGVRPVSEHTPRLRRRGPRLARLPGPESPSASAPGLAIAAPGLSKSRQTD